MSTQAAVRLDAVRKVFPARDGEVVAVDDVDLEVRDGEFFAMLGPSGSGKTTVLRMIAGFEQPTSGTVHLGGRDVTRDAPFDRHVNTVFQDYALFPHMSVLDNVAYGLMVKGVGRAERRTRADEALAGVRLEGFAARRPGQLSGGQRQRVALARALVNRPRVLLLDEPLGALDRKLREQMQVELKAIQRDVGITFVFVTHDQDEALRMSDRIAVLHRGRVEQIGTPQQVYERPASSFVAGFVGTSNLLRGDLAQAVLGGSSTVTIRPEKLRIAGADAPAPARIAADGVVSETVYTGVATRVVVHLDAGADVTVLVPHGGGVEVPVRGDRVQVGVDPADVYRLADDPAGAADPGDDPRSDHPTPATRATDHHDRGPAARQKGTT